MSVVLYLEKLNKKFKPKKKQKNKKVRYKSMLVAKDSTETGLVHFEKNGKQKRRK